MTAEIKTLCDIPPDAVPLEVVEVVGYLDAAGNRCYSVRYMGDSPLSTTLGLLRIAEHRVVHDACAGGRTGTFFPDE